MTPTMTVTLSNGVTYTVTGRASIVPDDDIARSVLAVMDTGDPVGPSTDEFDGVTADWDHPSAAVAVWFAFHDVAAASDLDVTATNLTVDATAPPVTPGPPPEDAAWVALDDRDRLDALEARVRTLEAKLILHSL